MTLVAHLAGSPLTESAAALSRLYASGCVDALSDVDGYRFLLIYVEPGGCWRFPASFGADDVAAVPALSTAEAVQRLSTAGIDVAVPHMFCIPGMTTYRAMLELLRIPYVGNRPATMALTADKAATRAIVSAAGVDVPPGELLRAGDVATLEPPVVVKPADSDNSFGVSLVRNESELPAAVELARRESRSVLVETYVPPGREVRCGVIVRDGELVCLPLEEYAVDADTKPIRNADDKLAHDDSGDLFLVAKTSDRAWIVDESDPITPAVWDVARRCHVALGCRHYSLFDFRIDPDGRVWFLEAGLYNSFSRSSVVATMARAAGIDVPELFAFAVNALRREDDEREES